VKWYRLAAKQGLAPAIASVKRNADLAKLRGGGPIEDLKVQYQWYIQIKEMCVANGLLSKGKLDRLRENASKIKVMLLRKHKVPKDKHQKVNQSSYNAALEWLNAQYFWKMGKVQGLVGGNMELNYQQKSKLKPQCRNMLNTASMLQRPYLLKYGNKKSKKKSKAPF